MKTRITYDKEIDAQYIYLKEGKIAHTKPLEDWLMIDLNERGEILGVEILDVAKHTTNLTPGMTKKQIKALF